MRIAFVSFISKATVSAPREPRITFNKHSI